LREAKEYIDQMMTVEGVAVELPSREAAEAFAREAARLGALATTEKSEAGAWPSQRTRA
jgi:hypothetical protein